MVAVHSDGTVDLKLADGTVLQKIHSQDLQRNATLVADEGRPLSAASEVSSRHGNDEALKSLMEENLRLEAQVEAARSTRSPTPIPPTSAASSRGGDADDSCSVASSSRACQMPSIGVDLGCIEQGVQRKGGRRSLSAVRAAQSEISSALSWE